MAHEQLEDAQSDQWPGRRQKRSSPRLIVGVALGLPILSVGGLWLSNVRVESENASQEGASVSNGDANAVTVQTQEAISGCNLNNVEVHGDVYCGPSLASEPDEGDPELSLPDVPKSATNASAVAQSSPTAITASPTTAERTATSAPTIASNDAIGVPIINDEPILGDLVEDYTWFEPPSDINSAGYGDSGFRFTLAIGNGGHSELDNYARWDFRDVAAGKYDIQPWIPSRWATAEIQYLVWVDEDDDGGFSESENLYSSWLDQEYGAETNPGWTSLGEPVSLSGSVRIEIHDTRSRDDYRTNNPDKVESIVTSRMAADAIRLVKVG